MIRMMTGAERAHLPNVETVNDYSGHEAGRVLHRSDCPRYACHPYDIGGPLRPACTEAGCSFGRPLYMEITHVGLVLSTGEVNGYDDSDFFAVVWDTVKAEPARVTYASTRGWTYPNGATVDATPEVLEAYAAHQTRKAAEARVYREAERAKLPEVGKVVKVVKGRKVPIGTVAQVFWTGPDTYDRGSRYANPHARELHLAVLGFNPKQYARIGIQLANGSRVFTASANVEVCEVTR